MRPKIWLPRPGANFAETTGSPKDELHATTFGFVYVNEVGREAFRGQPFAFPEGTIIVRERVLPPSTNPDQLVVMIKRERNFNRKANGWEFLTISGDATKVLKRERNGKCLKCHSGAASDFVFPEDNQR